MISLHRGHCRCGRRPQLARYAITATTPMTTRWRSSSTAAVCWTNPIVIPPISRVPYWGAGPPVATGRFGWRRSYGSRAHDQAEENPALLRSASASDTPAGAARPRVPRCAEDVAHRCFPSPVRDRWTPPQLRSLSRVNTLTPSIRAPRPANKKQHSGRRSGRSGRRRAGACGPYLAAMRSVEVLTTEPRRSETGRRLGRPVPWVVPGD